MFVSFLFYKCNIFFTKVKTFLIIFRKIKEKYSCVADNEYYRLVLKEIETMTTKQIMELLLKIHEIKEGPSSFKLGCCPKNNCCRL